MTSPACSAYHCTKPGTRFDASTWMFACKEHEEKWYSQMIELGVACLNSHLFTTQDGMCAVVGCSNHGCYYKDSLNYCRHHAKVGATCGFVNSVNNVVKFTMCVCKNDHTNAIVDNSLIVCYTCGEKLKFE